MIKNIECLRLIVLTSVLVLLSCNSTEKYYLSENLKSHGGIEALTEIHSKKLTGKFIIRQQSEIHFSIYLRKPDCIRVESIDSSKTYISAYDGETCWWINTLMNVHAPVVMPQPDASRLIDMQMLYWGYLEQAQTNMYNFEFLGKERIKDQEYYILKLTKNGHEESLYLDTESFLERRLVGKLPDLGVKAETVFGDYKKVDKIYIPHKFEFIINGNREVITIIDNVELNVPVDDSLFSMPVAFLQTK